jgi:Tol biopolymer transport system component
MGKVWRAHHTALKRDDALKVLPDAFASDPERLARFQREAQVLASLNHPNIAHVYGLEQADGVQALVMELVDGPTLADRIAEEPIPLDEVLPIARQIAEALEAAHESGIVHRDLKPANIKLRPDGTVKVLDFGLAKAMEPAGTSTLNVSQSPTITTPAVTVAGIVLGTAAYMAPEQARGKSVDKRADIWAFGAVMYEMITGRKAFDADDTSMTLASVMLKEPDWTALPPGTPSGLRSLLARCLKKDPKARLRDIGEARFQIDQLRLDVQEEPKEPAVAHVAPAWLRVLPWALAALGFAAAAALFVMWAPGRSVPASPLRLEASIGADADLATDQGPAAILSPDGKTLAFVAQKAMATDSQLYVRRLEQLAATPLAGTDGARNPFFSPDGQWIGFFAGGKLKKVAVSGGAVVVLCDAPDGRGGSWTEDGTITFLPVSTARGGPTGGGGLLRVSADGGRPEAATTIGEDELTQRWPQVLPGGRAVLYTVTNATATRSAAGAYADANIVAQSIPKGTPKVVRRGGYFGRYLPSGHLVYVHDGTLFAAPFDAARLELTGAPVPVLEGMVFSPNAGAAQVAVSGAGTLVYVAGGSQLARAYQFEWRDRTGKTTPLPNAATNGWVALQISPDGHRIAGVVADGNRPDVWIYDVDREVPSRLTNVPGRGAFGPVWTPDGKRVAYSSMIGGRSLYWQRADGTGEVQRLTTGPNAQTAGSWHPTGKFLAFEEITPQKLSDIMILPMEGSEAAGWKPGTPTPFLNSEFSEQDPAFSPDGRWLAYMSTKSGRPEVYVRPFPAALGEWSISTGGARFPVWSRARSELFYTTLQGEIMMVSYTVQGDAFRAGKPEPWSKDRFQTAGTVRRFDLHPDGERFLLAPIPRPDATVKQEKVVFVFNWLDELKRLVPRN